jgi:hypothetical protein
MKMVKLMSHKKKKRKISGTQLKMNVDEENLMQMHVHEADTVMFQRVISINIF